MSSHPIDERAASAASEMSPAGSAPADIDASEDKTQAFIDQLLGNVVDSRYRVDELIGRGGWDLYLRPGTWVSTVRWR